MRALIGDVADFAYGHFGDGLPVSRSPSDLGEICRAAVAEFSALSPDRTIRFVGEGDLRGLCDRARIEQLLANLKDEESQGLGLGLFIVKEIMRAHGGTVDVRSSETEGTTFTCLWPRATPAAARA